MFNRNSESKKRTLVIVSDNQSHKLNPGDKYQLDVNVDFSKNKTSVVIKVPITFFWDGFTLRKVDGP